MELNLWRNQTCWSREEERADYCVSIKVGQKVENGLKNAPENYKRYPWIRNSSINRVSAGRACSRILDKLPRRTICPTSSGNRVLYQYQLCPWRRQYSLLSWRRCRRWWCRCQSVSSPHRTIRYIPLLRYHQKISPLQSPRKIAGRSRRFHHETLQRLRRLAIHIPRNQPSRRHPHNRTLPIKISNNRTL